MNSAFHLSGGKFASLGLMPTLACLAKVNTVMRVHPFFVKQSVNQNF